MKPQIFISHTDTEDADASAFRASLSRGLDENGFDVLLDEQRIELGSDWRRELYIWILSCHAGVILVSEKALAGTPWMQFEASVLVMLREGTLIAGEPVFPVIPVAIPPVQPEQIADSWLKPLALDEIQGGRASESLVERIAARFEPLKASLTDTPLRALQRVIGPWLRNVDGDVLREAGRALGTKTSTWRPDEVADRIIRELLKADLDAASAAMQELAPQLPSHAMNLLEILAAGWVDPEAAAKLPPITRCDGRRLVAINGLRAQFTASTYVQRAWARYPSLEIMYVTEPGELDTEGMTTEIVAAVRSSHPEFSSEKDVMDYIAFAARRDAFLVAVRGLPERQTIDALAARFPDATFMFLSGPDVPPVAQRAQSGVEYLLPVLDAQREQNAFFVYAQTKALVERARR